MIRIALLVFILTALSAPTFAQQRPLDTEDPETIGSGRMLLEFGVDYRQDWNNPVSGLRGNLFAVPVIGVSLGVSSIAEIQVYAGGYQNLRITEQDPDAPFSDLLELDGLMTDDLEDLRVGAKLRVVSETAKRPSIATWFTTRLPTAGNESGLGKDLQDFYTSFLVAKTIQSTRVVANVGFLMLADPVHPAAQDDLLTYSLSVARAVSPSAEFVGEFVGRANFARTTTPGAEDRGLFRFGARYTHGSIRLDAGILLGLTSRDPEFGATTGLTWVFNAFNIP